MSPWIVELAQWLFLGFFVALNGSYLLLDLVSMLVIQRRMDTQLLAALPQHSSGMEPGISVLVPAYNEEANIVDSLRSLFQTDYPNFEVIAINDGSKDRTLEVLIAEFDLKLFPQAYHVAVPVQPIRGVYRSKRFPNLIVIDKENGGKADALNAGINAATHALFCAVDADSILQRDSLRRIAQPFMEDRRVVAAGGTIRLANGCTIRQGHIEHVDMPKSWIARVQIVEYLRAFLFGRLGWSPSNGLLIISGAFGLFRRQTVIDVGGYLTGTIGEDMELIVRLHRHLRAKRIDYRIVYVSEPTCWTEAPESLKVLRSQRVRWQRGLIESLWSNRQLMFSRHGGAAGWVAFPVFTVLEAAGPAIEVAGWLFLLVCTLFGLMSPLAFLAFILLAVALGLLLSASALMLEEMAFHQYPRAKHSALLWGAMLFENLGYRQLNTLWRIEGTWKWFRGRPQVWGEMTRKGLRA